MKTIIYTWTGKKWRRREFSTQEKALVFIARHNITEYDDELGYRSYIL